MTTEAAKDLAEKWAAEACRCRDETGDGADKAIEPRGTHGGGRTRSWHQSPTMVRKRGVGVRGCLVCRCLGMSRCSEPRAVQSRAGALGKTSLRAEPRHEIYLAQPRPPIGLALTATPYYRHRSAPVFPALALLTFPHFRSLPQR